MDYSKVLNIDYGQAVCYSGYRQGQSPGEIYPTYNQVKEDLFIVNKTWKYIRLYSCDFHSKTVLEVIKNEKLPLKVMLGCYIEAEVSNYSCPWGGEYSDEKLEINKKRNLERIDLLAKFGNEFPEIIFSLSIGNEACVSWTDHMVPVDSVVKFAKIIKSKAKQPVTFCENYVTWVNKLEKLVEVIDFISIHTYPQWENIYIDNALDYTIENLNLVRSKYPEKLIVITEAGWTSNTNDLEIKKHNTSEHFQKIYYKQLSKWSKEEKVLTFLFEAFDEPWKGSNDPFEPEKHWGVFKEDRTPKIALKKEVYKK